LTEPPAVFRGRVGLQIRLLRGGVDIPDGDALSLIYEGTRAVGTYPLEGEADPDILRPRMLVEGYGPQYPVHVRVAHVDDDVVPQGRTGLDGPHGLEQGRHAHAAVRRGGGGHRVVVAHEQHLLAGVVGAGDASYDVLEAPRVHLVAMQALIVVAEARGLLHPGREAEILEPVHYVVRHFLVFI
jgi:hypothetical protein